MIMKRPELLMCDIDGTLVEKGGVPEGKTRKILQILHDEGVMLGLASGRPVDQRTIGRFRNWGYDFDPDIVIGVNGCEIWDKISKQKRKFNYLPKEMTRKILDYMWDLDINVCVFEDGYNKVLARRKDWMIEESMNRNKSNVIFADKERFCENDIPKLEFHYNEEEYEDIINELLSHHKDEGYVWIKSFYGTLEFMKPGIDKGIALEMICKELSIPLKEVIACGDMDNDIAMLKKAGVGICLANGSKLTKEAADFVTENDVYHDGLGEFLFEYLDIES
jgi:Cof subfamily protein (haloacid dehalogenase superfamily)